MWGHIFWQSRDISNRDIYPCLPCITSFTNSTIFTKPLTLTLFFDNIPDSFFQFSGYTGAGWMDGKTTVVAAEESFTHSILVLGGIVVAMNADVDGLDCFFEVGVVFVEDWVDFVGLAVVMMMMAKIMIATVSHNFMMIVWHSLDSRQKF